MPKSPEGGYVPSPEEEKKAGEMMAPEEESKENKDLELMRGSKFFDSKGHMIEFGERGDVTEYVRARENTGQSMKDKLKDILTDRIIEVPTSRGIEKFEKSGKAMEPEEWLEFFEEQASDLKVAISEEEKKLTEMERKLTNFDEDQRVKKEQRRAMPQKPIITDEQKKELGLEGMVFGEPFDLDDDKAFLEQDIVEIKQHLERLRALLNFFQNKQIKLDAELNRAQNN